MRQLIILVLLFLNFPTLLSAEQNIRFAIIGDYGADTRGEAKVAQLVKSWEPEFIITLGDNNYPHGLASSIDAHIGKYYANFIGSYHGKYGTGSLENRFFPSLGNHDWGYGSNSAYLAYFTLPEGPGNERYYEFVRGPVHFFAIDSDRHEPDGIAADSKQALWLKERLAASKSPWKIVYLHHPPYASSRQGGNTRLRWPYREWGATVVLAGHHHFYERLEVDGQIYLINGLGGKSAYGFSRPLPQSKVRYNQKYGAQIVTANEKQLSIGFCTIEHELKDRLVLGTAAKDSEPICGKVSPPPSPAVSTQ